MDLLRDTFTRSSASRNFDREELYLLGATFLTGCAYFIYSAFPDGYYQHDEVAHYLSMMGFWHEPDSVLSNWAKPGYKIVYAIPALFGETFLAFFNSMVAAFTCYISYKCARESGSQIPSLAFILLATMPLWIQLSFRNYSEILTAFLLILATLQHLKSRYIVASLVLSYVVFIRQEIYPILMLYGLYLLYKKQGRAMLALTIFPLIHNMWGYFVTGDWLYLAHQLLSSSQKGHGTYVRQGFDHYFLMSIVIFGALSLTMLIGYFGKCILDRRWPKPIYFIPFAIYFIMHSLFNLQGFQIGASTGGNLRYMLVVAPQAAILANLGAESIFKSDNRLPLLWFLIPFQIVVAVFMTHDHNYIFYFFHHEWTHLILVIIAILGILIINKSKHLIYFSLVAGILFSVSTIKPFELTPEEKTVKQAVEWLKERELADRPIVAQHTMVFYYLGYSKAEYEERIYDVTKNEIEEAPIGSVIIWDSHYSHRPRLREHSISSSYLEKRSDTFRRLKIFKSEHGGFWIEVYEKR